MKINFYYMDGLGNKFNIFDLRNNHFLDIDDICEISDKFNISKDFDQLILIYNSQKNDAFIKIYNNDLSEAMACGNATRCVAKILCDESNKDNVIIETSNRELFIERINNLYKVNMGVPLTNWQDIPLSHEIAEINLLNKEIFGKAYPVNIGNPHLVYIMDDIDRINLKNDVSFIEKDPLFPEGVNINLVQILGNDRIKIRTWERGAGITLACGSGACASFYISFINGYIGDKATIELAGGNLEVSISKEGEIYMLGDANLNLLKNIENY